MNTKPRNGAAIEKIIIHDPEGANTADELYRFLQGIDAGYHSLCDDLEEVIAAADDVIVQGAGGMNTHALHVCVVPGRAAWTREQWLVHRPAIERTGRRIGAWCKKHGIPVKVLTPREMATDGVRGIGTHAIVSAAAQYDPIFYASDGHTDPGSQFPMDVCLAAANQVVNPPKPIDWAAIIKLDQWRKRVALSPLRMGSQGNDVRILIDLLRAKHFLRRGVMGDKYGLRVRRAVWKMKVAAKMTNTNGKVFGGDAANALLKFG